MKKALVYGAGNIGRGFIGQLFALSGYQVSFIDVNPVVLEALNRDRRYPVRVVRDDGFAESWVEGVGGIDGTDGEAVSGAIAGADIMATAIGVNILPKIAGMFAAGFRKRWNQGIFKPLNIILCENLIDANEKMAVWICDFLDPAERALFDRTIGLVEASVGRMVPVMTEAMQEGNPLRIWVEEFHQLPVDRDGFKGEIPSIKDVVPCSPFGLYIQRKLFMHNMGHSFAAYLGARHSDKYIWQALQRPAVKSAVQEALDLSAAALAAEHHVAAQELEEHAADLLSRFCNRMLGDTVARVGKDPVRKLGPEDRLVGAARLCISHGMPFSPFALGIAAALLFKDPDDTAAMMMQNRIASQGVEAVLFEISGITPDEPLGRAVLKNYRDMASSV